MKKIVLLSLLATVLSCSPSSPKLAYTVFGEKVSNSVSVDFNPKVDILFVVDNSGSMESHQQRLSKNVEALTKSIDDNKVIDYHIGVITTTMEDYYGSSFAGGRLVSTPGGPKFVDRNTVNGLQILKDYLRVGTGGSSTEKFFQPIIAAVTPPLINTENYGFLRNDAILVFIFITDTDDQSVNPLNGRDYAATDFVNAVVNIKGGDSKKVIPYGVVIPSSGIPTSGCTRDEFSPAKLESVITSLAGFEYNLCDSNYGANLDELGKDIATRVGKVLYLTKRPVPSTIVVKIGNDIIPNDAKNGWAYDPEKNAIIFGDNLVIQPNAGTNKLDVSYTAIPEE